MLCQRGDISFADKVDNVKNGGGVAAVIYNNVASDATCGDFAGTLGDGVTSTIPAISVSCADGTAALGHVGGPGTAVSQVTLRASGYEAWSGTSMATPHVSGVAALVWSHCPNATAAQVRDALDADRPGQGHGRVATTRTGTASSRPRPPSTTWPPVRPATSGRSSPSGPGATRSGGPFHGLRCTSAIPRWVFASLLLRTCRLVPMTTSADSSCAFDHRRRHFAPAARAIPSSIRRPALAPPQKSTRNAARPRGHARLLRVQPRLVGRRTRAAGRGSPSPARRRASSRPARASSCGSGAPAPGS